MMLLLPVAAARGITAPADTPALSVLRAGGGSSGGGSSGGGGGSSGGGGTHGTHRHPSGTASGNPIAALIPIILFLTVSSGSVILYRLKLSTYARNTKRLMAMLQKKDNAWKYKHIQKQVKDTYFVVQNAWTNLDMQPAKPYMSEELYESFNTKISWLIYKKQHNVLRRIRLREAIPVSVHDDENDAQDFVWFHIKGSMIDYTINTETNARIDGSTSASSFVEFWQFVRRDGRWVLNRILQKDEAQSIVFTTQE